MSFLFTPVIHNESSTHRLIPDISSDFLSWEQKPSGGSAAIVGEATDLFPALGSHQGSCTDSLSETRFLALVGVCLEKPWFHDRLYFFTFGASGFFVSVLRDFSPTVCVPKDLAGGPEVIILDI